MTIDSFGHYEYYSTQFMEKVTGKILMSALAMLFLLVLHAGNAFAQSHNRAAKNCLFHDDYLKATKDKKNSVACVDCFCKVCGNKKEIARKQKLERERLASDQKHKADEQGRKLEYSKGVSEKQRQAELARKKAKENDVVVVAPRSAGSVDAKDVIKVERENMGRDEKKRAWTPRFSQRTKEAGFGFFDENANWVWALQTPGFRESASFGSFPENGEYAVVVVAGDGNDRRTGSCGTDYYAMTEGIINRKGELVKQGKAGTDFLLIDATPFAVEMVENEYKGGGGNACSAHIFNIATGKVVASLRSNRSGEYFTGVNFVNSEGVMWFRASDPKFNYKYRYSAVPTSQAFTDNLRKEFATGRYNVFVVYAHQAFKADQGVTGYLFGNDGSFKVVADSWVSKYRDMSKE
mgnify:CR=1 FL=1